MKPYVFLPFVLLIGLVMGAWGTRNDLREVKEELREVKAQKGVGARRSIEIGSGVTQLLNINSGVATIDDREQKTEVREDKTDAAEEEDSHRDTESTELADEEKVEKEEREELTPEERRSEMEENIQRAAELWEARAKIARATFVDRAELTDEQAVKFDVLVDAMNLRMADTIEKWTVEAESKETLGPEDGIKLVNSVTDVMVSAYDDLDRNMPENWREKNDGEMNVTDFIDPEVAMPLVRLDGKMEGMGGSFE
ncbi:hypothetical protein BVX97_03840 [bacterium E08(2017)]|nr:hypothetical protein BVX97_03840 [bacterium E08(2017)]